MVVHKRFYDDDGEQAEQPEGVVAGPAVKSDPQFASERKSKQPISIAKNNPRKGSKSKPTGVCKSFGAQTRDLERFLKNKGPTLPPQVLKAKKEMLVELQRIASGKQQRKCEFRASKRYHKVRFFERRKLMRQLQRIEEQGNLPEEAEDKRHVLRDLQYVNYFPKGRKYVALFPKQGHTEESRAKVEAIRADIAQMLGDDTNDRSKTHYDSTNHPGDNKTNEDDDDFFLADDSDE